MDEAGREFDADQMEEFQCVIGRWLDNDMLPHVIEFEHADPESARVLHQVRVGVGTCGWGRWLL